MFTKTTICHDTKYIHQVIDQLKCYLENITRSHMKTQHQNYGIKSIQKRAVGTSMEPSVFTNGVSAWNINGERDESPVIGNPVRVSPH